MSLLRGNQGTSPTLTAVRAEFGLTDSGAPHSAASMFPRVGVYLLRIVSGLGRGLTMEVGFEEGPWDSSLPVTHLPAGPSARSLQGDADQPSASVSLSEHLLCARWSLSEHLLCARRGGYVDAVHASQNSQRWGLGLSLKNPH